MNASHPRTVLVVGCPRSGTTWLEQLLCAHPAMVAFPGGESRLFDGLHSVWLAHGATGRTDPAVVIDACRRYSDAVLARAHECAGPHATHLVEKTPAHALMLDFIGRVQPDAFVIHLQRDGRDVARSLREFELGTPTLADGARGWSDTIAAVRRDAPRLRFFRGVRYEDLVADPVAGVSALMEWTGLPVDDAVASEIAARAGRRVSQFNTAGPVGPGKWRSLTDAELREIYAVAGDDLVALGYATPADVR